MPQAADAVLSIETTGTDTNPIEDNIPVMLIDDRAQNANKANSGKYYIYPVVNDTHSNNSAINVIIPWGEDDNNNQPP